MQRVLDKNAIIPADLNISHSELTLTAPNKKSYRM